MGEIILGGRYIIENEIGTGGMAIVYRAHDKMLNRTVAVKVLRPEFKQDEEFIKRFDIEAKSAAGLNHPNIVAIYDVGIHEGLRYIVMEYIEGVTLKDFIAKNGKIPWRNALKFTSQICSALNHAHERKIIHRDIKPHNIMVTGDGSLKVMDFGIARATSASTLTIGSKVLGSAHYLSPEQARGGFTDERSDLYSLGVCLYEMVTGVVPFDAETTVAVAMQHLQKDPEKPSDITEDLPEAVEYIILKAMRKEQSQRYSSARYMESDIMRVLADSEVELSDEDNGTFYSTKQMDALDEEDDNAKNEKKAKGNKKKFAMLALFLFVSVGVMVAFFAYIFSGTGDKVNLVPKLLGCTLEEAEEIVAAIDENVLVIVKKKDHSLWEEKDKVIKQEPEAGTNMPGTKEIYVVIGLGEKEFELESYVGDKLEDVEEKVEDVGLIIRTEEETDDDLSEKYEEGRITRQEPSPGTVIEAGETVTVYVSKGKENVNPKVPTVVGMYADEAEQLLNDEGYNNVKIEEKESSEEENTVIEQSPSAGERLSKDETVTITVAIPEKEIEINPGNNIQTEPGINVIRPGDEQKEPRRTNVTFTVPEGEAAVNVKVIRKDNGDTVYMRAHNPGDIVRVDVIITGEVVYEIYINDEKYDEKRVHG